MGLGDADQPRMGTEESIMLKPYYQDDAVTIYHGDCREIMPQLGRFDLLLTDPPYDVHAGKGGGCFGNRDHLVNTGGFTDGGVDFGFLDGFQNWFCFCSRLQLPALLTVAQTAPRWNLLTWCKPNPVPTCNNKYLPDVEFVVHGFSSGRLFGDMSVKSCFMLCPCGNKETPHPNEKPLAIVKKLVTLGTQNKETILDPFAGSGTTGRAAKDLGRKATLIEREERYCEIAAKRMAQEVLPLEYRDNT
jgi:site-specific DNA-methyltransferase (adenine-specific)